MDLSFIVVLWVIISILQAINDRKKAPPPPQIPPQDLDFEIPTLRQPDEVEEIEIDDIEEIYQHKKDNVAEKFQNKSEIVEEKNNELDFTPTAMMNSIIMNEILDKPKSLRRKKF